MIRAMLRSIALALACLAATSNAEGIVDSLPKDAAGKPMVVSQIMVMFKSGVEPRPRALVSEAVSRQLTKAVGVVLKPVRFLAQQDWQLFQLPAAVAEDESQAIAAKLKTLAMVLDAWPNLPTQIVSPPGQPPHIKFLDEDSDDARFMTWSYHNVSNVEGVTVRFRTVDDAIPGELAAASVVAQISRLAGIGLTQVSARPHSFTGSEEFKMSQRMTQRDAEAVCARIQRHPKVQYCSPNGIASAMAIVTNDPELWRQWGLSSNTPGGAHVDEAWSTTTGTNTVVAVLDTGRLTHTELTGRYLPGYDFITDPARSGDGDGRDADPEDRGDWITEPETTDSGGMFYNCVGQRVWSIVPPAVPDPYRPPVVLSETAGTQTIRYVTSSWHGGHVAGTIGASANNGRGGAGINWGARILPVRTLGKCGKGTAPDVSDGIFWSVGVNIAPAGVNPNVANVVNMSLSGPGVCPPDLQSAIDEAVRRGALAVAAAGNDARISGTYWPASCKGVLTVVATDIYAKRWPESNLALGAANVISAPGESIFSLSNPGTKQPVAGDAYAYRSGTSMAAAYVSGIASLVMAAKPGAKPAEVMAILKGTTTPFPKLPNGLVVLGDCAIGGCGPGIINAADAMARARGKSASSSVDGAIIPAHGLALMPDGRVVAWGNNGCGQLGDGSFTSRTHAERVPGLTGIRRVLAVNDTSFAVAEDGRLLVWGCNRNLAFGVPEPSFAATPQVVSGLPPIRWIESASYLNPESVTPIRSTSLWC